MRLFRPSVKKLEARRDVAALSELLAGRSISERLGAAEALGRLADPAAAPALIEALRDASATDGRLVHDVAATALLAMAPQAMEDLVMTLGQRHPSMRDASADPMVRATAATILGHAGDRRATEALVTALSDESPDVRQAATEALTHLNDQGAVDGLLDAIPRLGASAIWALGEIGDQRATPAVIAWALPQDKVRNDAEEAAVAVRALGRLGPRDEVMPVIDRIRDHFGGPGSPYGDLVDQAISDALLTLGRA